MRNSQRESSKGKDGQMKNNHTTKTIDADNGLVLGSGVGVWVWVWVGAGEVIMPCALRLACKWTKLFGSPNPCLHRSQEVVADDVTNHRNGHENCQDGAKREENEGHRSRRSRWCLEQTSHAEGRRRVSFSPDLYAPATARECVERRKDAGDDEDEDA